MSNARHVADPSPVSKLKAILENSTSLMMLGYELKEETRAALAQLEPPAEGPALRKAALHYMAITSNAQLRRDVIEARGERSAANFRTRLNTDLETLAGKRHPVAGHARVGNGNGGAAL